MGVTDLLGTTAASVDLLTGELLEVSTYYPNGARETLWAEHDGDPVPLEPMGFTGKEADEEVGLVYFGERYLIARVGRWASADPLHVHASGGGEALNSYHYVAGNLLQARDPTGLDSVMTATEARGTPEEERLLDSGEMVADDMSDQFRDQYAVESEVIRTEHAVIIRPHDAPPDLIEAARERVRAAASARAAEKGLSGADADRLLESALANWEAARAAIVEWLGTDNSRTVLSPRTGATYLPEHVDSTIELTTTDARGNPLAWAQSGGSTTSVLMDEIGGPFVGYERSYRLNPYSWYLQDHPGAAWHSVMEGGAEAIVFGAASMVLHEYQHGTGRCLVPTGGLCYGLATIADLSPDWEKNAVLGTDSVTGVLPGGGVRGMYAPPDGVWSLPGRDFSLPSLNELSTGYED